MECRVLTWEDFYIKLLASVEGLSLDADTRVCRYYLIVSLMAMICELVCKI
jgi:hypothetical protein